MPKYADITPFYEWLDWLEKESNSRCPDYNTMMFYEIRDKLDDLPEVVRCKDCVKRGNDEECPMLSIMQYTEADDFCSFSAKVDGNG